MSSGLYALTGLSHTLRISLFAVCLLMWPLFHNHTHLLAPRRSLSGAACGGRDSSLHLLPTLFKVLSVGVGGDGDVDDEGRLVLDASVFTVGEGSDLHTVRVGLA